MQKIFIAGLIIIMAFISLLVILTKGQPLLVRKKIMLGLLIMSLTAPAATVVSCKSGTLFQDEIWEKHGWIDNDTYLIKASGEAQKNLKDVRMFQESAKRNAILNAQYMIKEKFQPQPMASCGGMGSYDISLEKEIQGIIKGGSVKAVRYKDLTCEIIYEVRAKDLRKKVQSLSY